MTKTQDIMLTPADQTSPLHDAQAMGAFARRLHERRHIPLHELARYIVASTPPAGYHTLRLVNVEGSDETILGSIDLAGDGYDRPRLVLNSPASPGARLEKWRALAVRPTIRPGVIDINMSISGNEAHSPVPGATAATI